MVTLLKFRKNASSKSCTAISDIHKLRYFKWNDLYFNCNFGFRNVQGNFNKQIFVVLKRTVFELQIFFFNMSVAMSLKTPSIIKTVSVFH